MKRVTWLCAMLCAMLFSVQSVLAQTDMDADMMNKNLFCTGLMYSHSSWDHYWEGTLKRNNQNLGTVSTQMVGWMGNYGVSKKLNILFNLPYAFTRASAGTLHGMKGFQDLSLFVKYKPLNISIGKGKLALLAIGGISIPTTDYVIDFLPLSIGLGSKQVIGRLMGDYQLGNFFVTASGTYTYRSNVFLDRDNYYTTEQHLTNEVEMPDAISVNLRTGYRSKRFTAEVVMNKMTTQGGFDITRNNMPFPSNRMNTTSAGLNFRYIPKPVKELTITAGADYVLDGRNVGQSKTFFGGIFYILNFSRKTTTTHSFQN